MSTQTCTEHGEDVVVYQDLRNSPCPLCLALAERDDARCDLDTAENTIEDLKSDLRAMEQDRDDLRAQVNQLEARDA